MLSMYYYSETVSQMLLTTSWKSAFMLITEQWTLMLLLWGLVHHLKSLIRFLRTLSLIQELSIFKDLLWTIMISRGAKLNRQNVLLSWVISFAKTIKRRIIRIFWTHLLSKSTSNKCIFRSQAWTMRWEFAFKLRNLSTRIFTTVVFPRLKKLIKCFVLRSWSCSSWLRVASVLELSLSSGLWSPQILEEVMKMVMILNQMIQSPSFSTTRSLLKLA